MEILTHNNSVSSNTLTPGYISYKCDVYGLPDNTMGEVGWHTCYGDTPPQLRQIALEHRQQASDEIDRREQDANGQYT